jgi:diguanylate cyclase (GGDEF)-like protein
MVNGLLLAHHQRSSQRHCTMSSVFQIICLSSSMPDLSTSAYGPFVLSTCASLSEVSDRLHVQPYDAVLLTADAQWPVERLLQWPAWSREATDCAVVVVAPEPQPLWALRLVHRGAQDVVPSREAHGDALGRVLRLAIERKRLEVASRQAFATDMATGLPNRPQLLEYITHLLALREREPAPMALLVLRVEGMAEAERRLGAESANVLRRQFAERLRASLRASDVVASIGDDVFAVLLAWIDAPDDGDQVAAKMALSAQRPFNVAGHACSLSVGMGVSQFPGHGNQADVLLRLAMDRAVGSASKPLTVTNPPGLRRG